MGVGVGVTVTVSGMQMGVRAGGYVYYIMVFSTQLSSSSAFFCLRVSNSLSESCTSKGVNKLAGSPPTALLSFSRSSLWRRSHLFYRRAVAPRARNVNANATEGAS